MAACLSEPLLSSIGPGHVVRLPQRALRQPRRRPDIPAPPLIRMLAAGRGSAEVRVRIYLWAWACLSTRNYSSIDLRKPTLDWAAIANLIADDTPGAKTHKEMTARKEAMASAGRRVTRAIDYLESEKLISRPKPDLLCLLDPDCSGRPYEPWSPAVIAERRKERDDLYRFYASRIDYRRSQVWEDEPLALPATLWTNGTISALPAAAIIVLLILLDYEAEPGDLIKVPKSRAYEYPVAHSTWHKGLSNLESAGLIQKEPGPLVFSATNANPRIVTDRHRARWRINAPETRQ